MTTPMTTFRKPRGLRNKVEDEEKQLEERERRLKAWESELDEQEVEFKQLSTELEKREEYAKARIKEVEQRRKRLEERENKMAKADQDTQRDQRFVNRCPPRPVWERRQVEIMEGKALFVGNIPHTVDKAELTDYFQQFGKVQELTMKNGIKSGGKQHPNFSFISFEDSRTVQQILSKRPLCLYDKFQLNVEQMRARPTRKGVVPTHDAGQQGEVKTVVTSSPGPSEEPEKAPTPTKMSTAIDEKSLEALGHEQQLSQIEMEPDERREEEKDEALLKEVVSQKTMSESEDTVGSPAVLDTQKDPIPEGRPAVNTVRRPALERKQQAEAIRPITHKLFVGNLPQNVDKPELVSFLEQFGKVLELNIKKGSKRNFSFVVFDDSETVQRILSEESIMFSGNCLNVEEMRLPRKGPPNHMQKRNFDNRQIVQPDQMEKSTVTDTLGSTGEAEKAAREEVKGHNPVADQDEEDKSVVTSTPGPLPEAEKVPKPTAMLEETARLPNLDGQALMEMEINRGEKQEKNTVRVIEVGEGEVVQNTPVPERLGEQKHGCHTGTHLRTRPVREQKQGELNKFTHQVFVGNIPHDVEKAELAELFEQFGKVTHVVIKKGSKHPNFGFVGFEDLETVQQVLNKRFIQFRGNRHINVEAMKTRSVWKGGPRGSPTHTQKPNFDGQEEHEKFVVNATPGPLAEAVHLETNSGGRE